MERQFLLSLNLQLFAEEATIETGADAVPAAEVQTETQEPSSESGVETEVAAEPEKMNNFEKAFAKRLADAQSKWEADKQAEIQKLQEQYSDYDTHKELSQYFQEINNMDALTLKEQIELDRLQKRAEQANVPPEVLKRIDELEAKAARADELEQQRETEIRQVEEQQQLQQWYTQFRSDLEAFAKENEIGADELEKYMVEQEIKDFRVAHRAMKAEDYEKRAQQHEQEVIKRYLESKQAPRVEGAGVPGQTQIDTSKMSWGDLRSRVAAKIQAAFTNE